jgi:hypothetical protein
MCAGLAVSPGSKTVQNKNKKIQATSDVFKIECCVSSLLPTSNRMNEVEKKVDDF